MQKIWILAIIVTFMMLGSGIAVLGSSPTAVSNGASVKGITSYTVPANQTVLYEYKIYNNGTQFSNKIFPFYFSNNLFSFNLTNGVVQNIEFLYGNGTQIHGWMPDYNTVFGNMKQSNGTYLVFLNLSMKSYSSMPIYLRVFPDNMSVLNANLSGASSSNIGITTQFNKNTTWIHSNNAASLSLNGNSIVETGIASTLTTVNLSMNASVSNGYSVNYTITYTAPSSTSESSTIQNGTFLGNWNNNFGFGSRQDLSGHLYAAYRGSSGYQQSSTTGLQYGDFTVNSTYNSTKHKLGGESVSSNPSGYDISANLSTTIDTFGGTIQNENQAVITIQNFTLVPDSVSFIHLKAKAIGTTTKLQTQSSGNYIRFNQTGLPAGQSWNVSVKNNSAGVNQIYSSTSNTLKAFLPTGYNYSFIFATFDQSFYNITNLSGKILLPSSSNATVNITLINETYFVNYTESGLNSGTSWSITLNGTKQSSTSAEMHFLIRNGTYAWSLTYSNLYSANLTSGTVTVKGIAQTISIGFIYKAYNVTFSEVGLPSGVKWSMTINGTVYYSNLSRSNTLLFQSKAGSYDGIVNNASYYTPMDKYFNFTITGNAQYTVDYGIILTFIETGYNGLWHITINGVSYSSSTNTIVVTVSPGQVIYNVWGVSGYTISPELVTQTYTSAQTIKITFAVQPASFENVLISTPMIILYFVLAVMTMVGVVYWRLKHEK